MSLPSAGTIVRIFRAAGLTVATVESCTGGLVAAAITDVAGSSAIFERGFVTYSNSAKTDLVGVPPGLIEAHGAVSHEVAVAMAKGGLERSGADVAVSVTGIAGPGGGSPEKPVGLVHFALAWHGGTRHHVERFMADERSAIRRESVRTALGLLESWCRQRAADAAPAP